MPARPFPRRAVRAVAAAGTLAALVAAGLPAPAAAAAVPTMPFLSELHYDNSGTDAGEFVEVELPPGTTVAGWSVVLYNGGTGTAYDSDPLPATTAPAGSSATAVLDYPSNGIQNGAPDALALVDATGAVRELLSYEGVLTAVGGPADGRTSTDIGVAEAGTEPVGQSLSRRYDPASGSLVWQGPAAATRGAVHPPLQDAPPPAATCDAAPTAEIGAVQGTGDTSPFVGKQVTVRGTVVGDVPGLAGFYLQDAGDGDAATSDGLFVVSPAAVGLGNEVQVTGGVSEFFGQTQVSSTDGVAVCATGRALPAPAPLDLPADDAARERLEGMLVQPVDVLTVSEVFALTRFGELTLSEGGLLVQPTEVALPGAPAAAVTAASQARRIVLDDGTNAGTSVTRRPYLSPATPVRVGDPVAFTSPVVLGYGFGAWRLQPADGTAEGTIAPGNSRPAAPAPVGGDLQIGSFNVLNYFLTFAGPDARGARSQDQLDRQAAKTVPAIRALGAEVVTLLEIEDTGTTGYGDGSADLAVVDLVRRLNAAAGFAEWAYVPMPAKLLAVDRDAIRNAIIYKPAAVQAVGAPVGLVDESVWSNAREPIAQTFSAEGEVFTVVANHFKSKSPGSPTGDNVDTGDGQGSWNGDRVRQAESLAGFAAMLRRDTGDPDVLLAGDLNAYSREDPMRVLTGAGYEDLGRRDEGRYSYVFNALSGSLDHALASPELAAKVTGITHWNINSVESSAYQYTGDPALYAADPYRASDHDPVLLGIDLQERCGGLLPTIRGTYGDDVLQGTTGRDVIVGLGGNDVIDGLGGKDVVCGGSGDDRVTTGKGADVLYGGTGDDRLDGGNARDLLTGGPGADVLLPSRGPDVFVQEGRES